ncbi:YqzE family protein [Paenibacillus hexagrammi]|uniref:YqzE family protein n=1 Tax=Paenibacillus hexagrammi TaxID=2908839 RepID=A0ABY3SBZ1_9BACL|nr:YqzE family protein [Paenibacillus sp. YPD9-1]UJF31519.1 YqzE family protein [Paenibacillus sp. YPD9-1]
MAKSDDLVKFITQQVITYIETPKDVRRQVRASSKEQREAWQTRWFGMIPLSTKMLIDQTKSIKQALRRLKS